MEEALGGYGVVASALPKGTAWRAAERSFGCAMAEGGKESVLTDPARERRRLSPLHGSARDTGGRR